jgi:hypothetical protein
MAVQFPFLEKKKKLWFPLPTRFNMMLSVYAVCTNSSTYDDLIYIYIHTYVCVHEYVYMDIYVHGNMYTCITYSCAYKHAQP